MFPNKKFSHVSWLVQSKLMDLKTADGKPIEILEYRHRTDQAVLKDWAYHFRNHYCFDDEIDTLREGTGLSRTDYLLKIKFPDQYDGFGPGIRAGDFGEILVADYLEHVLKFWVPRTRYANKVVRNESTKGADVIGFKVVKVGEVSKDDTLAVFECKAQFSGEKAGPILQKAIDDSIKDIVRRAESLNAIKQRLVDKNLIEKSKVVARFQNPEDQPYKETFGATALFTEKVFDRTTIEKSTAAGHPGIQSLTLIVISGKDMMSLVHDLYKRAADEA